MKSKLKKRLRQLWPAVAAQVDPRFEIDPAFKDHLHLAVVRRRTHADFWQFLALSFSAQGDRFFVEAAYSPNDTFPAGRMPFGHDMPPHEGKLRFRVSGLWQQPDQSGGWLIWKPSDEPATDSVMKPEGVFETPELAMVDVRERMVKCILPYLDKVGVQPPPPR
jgi:hypothetical protein